MVLGQKQSGEGLLEELSRKERRRGPFLTFDHVEVTGVYVGPEGRQSKAELAVCAQIELRSSEQVTKRTSGNARSPPDASTHEA